MDPSRPTGSGGGAGAVSPADVRAECERLLATPTFQQAPTLARLLRYLVDESLSGNAERLKEFAVGFEVFGRGPSFDPRVDTIVRAHARRLRQRLSEHYRTDGRLSPVVLELPRGHYVVSARPATAADHERDESAPADSIVVLPFATSAADSADEYLADGLTEEIINALALMPGLHVVARTSAFQFRGRDDDVRQIGKALGVRLALEGSVRREGETVRVSTGLIDVRDGFQIWTMSSECTLTSAFRLQDELASAVVEGLRARLGIASAPLRLSAPTNADAHESYLKGRYFWNKATPDNVAKAVKHLRDAIACDPRYASAYAALADAFVYLATLEAESPGPLLEQARSAAARALELHDVAEAHSAMGAVLGIGDWAWKDAEREFTMAVTLAPSSAHIRGAFAMCCLAPQRRLADAVGQLRHAVRLDPLSTFQRAMLGQVLLLARRFEDARDEIEHALDLDPNHLVASLAHAWCFIAQGDFDAAVAVLRAMSPDASDVPNHAGHLGHALACAGERAAAESVLGNLLSRFPGPWVPGVDVAAIYCALGEHDEALSWLERAYQLRSFDVVFVGDDPRFTALTAHPRLLTLVTPHAGGART